MQNGLSPNYLSSLVPDNIGNNSAYKLRNAQNLKSVQANFQLYYKFCLPSVTRDWNELMEELRNIPTLSSFKRHLDSDLNAIPKLFFDGKRLGRIYHARLRMRYSTLNAHLFSKNIIDSPICVCGAREDTQHFLMSCTRYTNLRQEVVNRVTPVSQPSLNVFLFGSQELSDSDSDNRQIFFAVQDFLTKSKRFEVIHN